MLAGFSDGAGQRFEAFLFRL
ncbi:hypothetical protein ECFRIK523_0265, partial [Escherichia coli FRIK523]